MALNQEIWPKPVVLTLGGRSRQIRNSRLFLAIYVVQSSLGNKGDPILPIKLTIKHCLKFKFKKGFKKGIKTKKYFKAVSFNVYLEGVCNVPL